MLRHYLLASTVILLVMMAHAQPYNFAGLEWGTSQADTTEHLESRGYLERRPGSGVYEGSLLGRQVLVHPLFGDEGLSSVDLTFDFPIPVDRAALRSTYSELSSILIDRYGEPIVYAPVTAVDAYSATMEGGGTMSVWAGSLAGGDGIHTLSLVVGRALVGSILESPEGLRISLTYGGPRTVDRRGVDDL